jgi:hypothetical protein
MRVQLPHYYDKNHLYEIEETLDYLKD